MALIAQKLAIFIPSLATLDALLPLIYGVSKRQDYEIVLVVTDAKLEGFVGSAENQADVRIRFLKLISKLKIIQLSDYLGDTSRDINEILVAAAERIIESILDEGVECRFIFSTSLNSIEVYFAAAINALGLPLILLADSMFPIHPTSRRVLHNSGAELPYRVSQNDFSLFNSIVIPHCHSFDALGGFFPVSRAQLAGSARYSKEWLDLWQATCSKLIREGNEDTLTVTFLLRPHTYAVYWQEVVRTVQLLKVVCDARCTIQLHSEDGFLSHEEVSSKFYWLHELRSEVTIQSGLSPTICSIASSDLVIDTGTSAAFEALALGVPVIQLKYLQAYRPLLGALAPELSLKCRDDIVLRVSKNRQSLQTLSDGRRTELLRSLIGDKSLDSYVETVLGA